MKKTQSYEPDRCIQKLFFKWKWCVLNSVEFALKKTHSKPGPEYKLNFYLFLANKITYGFREYIGNSAFWGPIDIL